MNNLGKLVKVDDQPPEFLEDAIIRSSSDGGVVQLMLKDAHLPAAAMQADRRVLSLDDTVRAHFAQSLRCARQLADINWANPMNDEEHVVPWLEAGAPHEVDRLLIE
jgi:hypothetical protein